MREYLVLCEEALSHTVLYTVYSILLCTRSLPNFPVFLTVLLGIEHLTASKQKVDVTLPAQFTWTADTVKHFQFPLLKT